MFRSGGNVATWHAVSGVAVGSIEVQMPCTFFLPVGHSQPPPAALCGRDWLPFLVDTGLRDGLQILARTVPTAHKIAWLRGAHAAGLREFEVVSFVPPKVMPQMADAAEVLAGALALPGAVVSVLVPKVWVALMLKVSAGFVASE
jgi:hypothetical protein